MGSRWVLQKSDSCPGSGGRGDLIFVNMMFAAARAADLAKCEDWFDRSMEMRLQPSGRMYTALVTAAAVFRLHLCMMIYSGVGFFVSVFSHVSTPLDRCAQGIDGTSI